MKDVKEDHTTSFEGCDGRVVPALTLREEADCVSQFERLKLRIQQS
jgi:hypothetical protein